MLCPCVPSSSSAACSRHFPLVTHATQNILVTPAGSFTRVVYDIIWNILESAATTSGRVVWLLGLVPQTWKMLNISHVIQIGKFPIFVERP